MAAPFPPRWISWWFRGAALYGIAALAPLFLRTPPATGALFFYGFAGTALAFQLGFWIIGGDPVRHRALMPAAVLEKLAFVGPCAVLAAVGRIDAVTAAAGVVDLVLGLGFLVAWGATPRAARGA